MIYLGVDPDTHAMPIAAFSSIAIGKPSLETKHGILSIEVLRVPRDVKAEEAGVQMAQKLAEWGRSTIQGGLGVVLCVEMQHYVMRSRARPQDVARLSFLSGAAVGAIRAEHVYAPLPVQWKGNVPKLVHHRRIAQDLDWQVQESRGYCTPSGFEVSARDLVESPSDWKHAFDAIGLALWAKKQHEKRP